MLDWVDLEDLGNNKLEMSALPLTATELTQVFSFVELHSYFLQKNEQTNQRHNQKCRNCFATAY